MPEKLIRSVKKLMKRIPPEVIAALAAAFGVMIAVLLIGNAVSGRRIRREGGAAALSSAAAAGEVRTETYPEQTAGNEAAPSSGGEAGPAAAPASVSPESAAAEPAAPTPEPAREVSITVSAAGDCTLGSDESMDYDVSFYAKYEEVGYPGWFLENVQDVFADDDLTIVNLEGTLASGGEREDKTYAFRGDPEYVRILTEGSVEAVNLANNHSFDFGYDAYEETKQVLEDAGIVSFGYDRSQVIDVKGIKVGLVGVYELEKDYDCVYGMREEIDKVKEQGAQLIIVSFHWGDEGYYEANDTQIQLARDAVDAGADLVLGHHPHRVQGVVQYNGKYICYSLGNFCFGGHSSPSDLDSMIFTQTFTFVNGELQDTDDHRIVPCSISSAGSYNNYQPTILYGEEGDRVLQKIEELS